MSTQYHTQKGSTSSLFVSLFMLLLAFFIVLVALSSFEVKKARSVIQQVKSAFAEPNFLTEDLVRLELPDTAIAEVPFDEQVRKIFEDKLQVVKIKKVNRGNALRITVSVREFFKEGSLEIRQDNLEALNDIIAAARTPKPHTTNDMEIFFRVPFYKKDPSDEKKSLEKISQDRAGVLARTLLIYGMPKSRFGVGLQPSKKLNLIDFFFYIHPADKPKIDFAPPPPDEGAA